MSGRWSATQPSDACLWLAAARVPWWFAGGWAIDLWLGRESRPHSDLEVSCFRRDLPILLETFHGWDIQVARRKQLTPYDPSALPELPYSLWLRRRDDGPWDLEILPEEVVGDVWHYRRDRRVSRSISETLLRIAGKMVISPDVQLLYKAAHIRAKDEADFEAVRPLLSLAARDWLRGALAIAHPGHDWIGRL